MDIKVKIRTDKSIEVTFSDISTRTTIPLSISDTLSLQSRLANSLKTILSKSSVHHVNPLDCKEFGNNEEPLDPVIPNKGYIKEDYKAETEAAEKSIYGGIDTEEEGETI